MNSALYLILTAYDSARKIAVYMQFILCVLCSFIHSLRSTKQSNGIQIGNVEENNN